MGVRAPQHTQSQRDGTWNSKNATNRRHGDLLRPFPRGFNYSANERPINPQSSTLAAYGKRYGCNCQQQVLLEPVMPGWTHAAVQITLSTTLNLCAPSVNAPCLTVSKARIGALSSTSVPGLVRTHRTSPLFFATPAEPWHHLQPVRVGKFQQKKCVHRSWW